LIITIKNPKTSLGFIDRFLVSTESFRIPTTLIINKADLLIKSSDREKLEEIYQIYEPLGYQIKEISALYSEDLEQNFMDNLKGKTTLLSGHSGVGKSTFLNKIRPEAKQQTKEISKFSAKGVHTTTFAEMFELPENGYIIDTPGIKEFGILDIEENELSHYFIEMRQHLGKCKFHNCKHVNEPNCAIIQLVEKGEINISRYENYVNILFEEDDHR
jgi:ribosome biogenesis GTPase / thiamine phosphate phosphatase